MLLFTIVHSMQTKLRVKKGKEYERENREKASGEREKVAKIFFFLILSSGRVGNLRSFLK